MTLRVVLESARSAKREDYSLDKWRALKSAIRAAEIVLSRATAEQKDVNFVVDELCANM